MNDKFFFLPPDKQQRIINAGYKVFSQNNYKKAPMAEIASEGCISKALLFHYFTNKKGLYLYLWNNAIQQIRRSAQKYKVTDTDDFFEMIRRALLAKCHVISTSAYLYNFCVKAYYETEPEILSSIQSSFQAENAHSEDVILKTVNWSTFRGDIDTHLLYQQIIWMADGYLRQAVLSKKCDARLIEQDFLRMIEQWKRVYLK